MLVIGYSLIVCINQISLYNGSFLSDADLHSFDRFTQFRFVLN
jgi:hypothetical protein